MPALKAFCRVWEFGSDDLFFPALSSALVRAVWLLGLLGAVLHFRETLGCEHTPHYLAGLSAAFLLVTVLAVGTEAAIAVLSARGTITYVRPRRHVPTLLYLRAGMLALEVVMLAMGTAFAVRESQQESEEMGEEVEGAKDFCPHLDEALTAAKVVLGGYWVAMCIFLTLVVVYLDPCHCYSAQVRVNHAHLSKRLREGDVDQELVERHWEVVHSIWEKRFRVACCCLAGRDDAHRTAYREVAEIFAHLFCDTEVVMSDIAAGFLLLQREQLALERDGGKGGGRGKTRCHGDEELGLENGGNEGGNETDLPFDFQLEEDREIFQDSLYFLKYAIGMYSWPFYMYMNPLCGLCHLYPHLNCCCCRGGCGSDRTSHPSQVLKDNRCSCHLGGLRQFTDLEEEGDVVYASFENQLYMVPHAVCLDHHTKSVVLAFRGTLSFRDIVTDLMASTRPVEVVPGHPEFLVHKGMLQTASAILERLDEERVLERAFERVPGYRLVLVGHSLGAGCAGALSILLRGRYSDLRCFCYAPTGALLNEAAAHFTEGFVTSVTLGKDLVARLNVPNTHKMKDDLVRLLQTCRRPKCRVLLEGCLETLCSCFGRKFLFDSKGHAMPPGKSKHGMEESHTWEGLEVVSNDDEGAQSDVETNPLLSSAVSVDPEESLCISTTFRPLAGQGRGGSQTHPSRDIPEEEVMPILHPNLSALKLPVRSRGRDSSSGGREGSCSPSSSLTREVERRLLPLYLPGKVIHIVNRSDRGGCLCGSGGTSREFEARWSNRYKFDRILVSPEMVRDHFPDVLEKAMKRVWNSRQVDSEEL